MTPVDEYNLIETERLQPPLLTCPPAPRRALIVDERGTLHDVYEQRDGRWRNWRTRCCDKPLWELQWTIGPILRQCGA